MRFRKLILAVLMSVFLFSLASCTPDLGKYEDDADYIDSFEITWIDGDNNYIDTYSSMENFYYPELARTIDSPMEESTNMKYLYIKATKDLNIDSLVFYLKSDKGGFIGMNIFKSTDLLDESKLRNLEDELDALNNEEEIEADYSDLTENVISADLKELKSGKWKDSREFKIETTVKKDEYLVVQFVENVDIYYQNENLTKEILEELIEERNSKRIDLYLAAIFIRAV